MYKIITSDYEEVFEDTIGKWYPGQSHPQDIELYLNFQTRVAIIYYNGEVGNARPAAIFEGKAAVWQLPSKVYTIKHCKQILADIQPWLDKLIASYEEVYTGNGYKGQYSHVIYDEIEAILDEEFSYIDFIEDEDEDDDEDDEKE